MYLNTEVQAVSLFPVLLGSCGRVGGWEGLCLNGRFLIFFERLNLLGVSMMLSGTDNENIS